MCVLRSSNGLKFLDSIIYPEIEIKENSFTFITGRSGCGKSTYLKLLNGTALPCGGSVIYRGEPIEKLDVIAFRRKVTLVPQEVFLFDGTIRDNFNLYYSNREEPFLNETRMKDFLKICCADFPLGTLCGVLSGGERQRVFLAIFLSFASDVLLLDEPTAALDAGTSEHLLANIRHFCSEYGITAVIVSHSAELADKFADNVIKL